MILQFAQTSQMQLEKSISQSLSLSLFLIKHFIFPFLIPQLYFEHTQLCCSWLPLVGTQSSVHWDRALAETCCRLDSGLELKGMRSYLLSSWTEGRESRGSRRHSRQCVQQQVCASCGQDREMRGLPWSCSTSWEAETPFSSIHFLQNSVGGQAWHCHPVSSSLLTRLFAAGKLHSEKPQQKTPHAHLNPCQGQLPAAQHLEQEWEQKNGKEQNPSRGMVKCRGKEGSPRQ